MQLTLVRRESLPCSEYANSHRARNYENYQRRQQHGRGAALIKSARDRALHGFCRLDSQFVCPVNHVRLNARR